MSLTAANILELSRQRDQASGFLYQNEEQQREAQKNESALIANMLIEAILDNARQLKRI